MNETTGKQKQFLFASLVAIVLLGGSLLAPTLSAYADEEHKKGQKSSENDQGDNEGNCTSGTNGKYEHDCENNDQGDNEGNCTSGTNGKYEHDCENENNSVGIENNSGGNGNHFGWINNHADWITGINTWFNSFHLWHLGKD